MKFLRISSVLLALFFAVGCGSKTVDSTGGVTKDTVKQEEAANTEPTTEIAENTQPNGNEQGPEGGFMPLGTADGGSMDGGDTGYGNDGSANDPNAIAGAEDETTDTSNQEATETTLTDNDTNAGGAVVVDSLTTIYFDFDKYDIRQDMKDYIRANAEYIKSQNISSIVLQGNTDEFGGDEYNMALGQKRALSVRDALVLQGLPKSMFSTISYGTHKPVCQEKTAECYAKNRRTDLVENK